MFFPVHNSTAAIAASCGTVRLRKFAAVFFVVLALFGAVPAEAATKTTKPAPVKKTTVKPKTTASTFGAKEMIRSAKRVEVAPGQTVMFTIGFKNAGNGVWDNYGPNFVSVYSAGPYYRKSKFTDAAWVGETQPAKLQETTVKPGAIGKFTFPLFAPLEPGVYKETFILAAEDLKWIPGSLFAVEVVVKKPATVSGTDPAPGFKALKLLVSEREVNLNGGDTHEFKVGFKNIGKVPWTPAGSRQLTIRDTSQDSKLKFQHASWKRDVTAELAGSEVKPGGVAFFTFTIAAPKEGGKFTPRFSLMAGENPVDGGDLEIPIEVIQDEPPPPIVDIPDNEFANVGNRGPNIRVGICYLPRAWDEASRRDLPSCDHDMAQPIVLAAAGSYKLFDGNRQLIRALSGVTTIRYDFSSTLYTVQNGDFIYNSSNFVRFEPDDPASTIFEIQNLDNRPVWDQSINFNRYRGAIEIRYAPPPRDRLWIIEELPLEDYMRGLGETSNGSPYEYQKALVTAARTYALYVVGVGGKHVSEFHHLNRTGNDQVYKGYTSELVRPNVVRAVEETRGTAVTYGSEVVVTPYFSRSDGRTRSWGEVWYGSRPWLVSKPAPYDVGKTLWGHGVGMAASDAVGRANAGTGWREILQYYYTGIELKQVY